MHAAECAHWAFWPDDGGCHLSTNVSTVEQTQENVISGDGTCRGANLTMKESAGVIHNDLLKVVDMAKLEVLYLFGGIVMDADQDCLKKLDPLLQYGEAYDWIGVFENDRPGRIQSRSDLVANGVQIAHRYSPSTRRALAHVNHLNDGAAWGATGPCLVTSAIVNRCSEVQDLSEMCGPLKKQDSCSRYPQAPVLVLPSQTFYPYHHSDKGSMAKCELTVANSYTLQHWSSTHEAYNHSGGSLKHGIEWALDASTAEYVGEWAAPKCLGDGSFALPEPKALSGNETWTAFRQAQLVRFRHRIADGDQISLEANATAAQVERLEVCTNAIGYTYPRGCVDLQNVNNELVSGMRVQKFARLVTSIEMVILHSGNAKVRVDSSRD